MGEQPLVQGCVLEIRHKDTYERVSVHVRHSFEDLIRSIDLAISLGRTLTIVPYEGARRTIDPEDYRALAVFHYTKGFDAK